MRLTEEMLKDNQKKASLKVQPHKKGNEQYLGPDFWAAANRIPRNKDPSGLKGTTRLPHMEAQVEGQLKGGWYVYFFGIPVFVSFV